MNILEGAILLVFIQFIRSFVIVAHVDIRCPIIVVIPPDCSQTNVVSGNACRVADIGKTPALVVLKQMIGLAGDHQFHAATSLVHNAKELLVGGGDLVARLASFKQVAIHGFPRVAGEFGIRNVHVAMSHQIAIEKSILIIVRKGHHDTGSIEIQAE